MSSDEETSPAVLFTRSVCRANRRPALASPSEGENTPTPVKATAHASDQQQQQPSTACGYVRQQLQFDSPRVPATKGSCPNGVDSMQHRASQPLRAQAAALSNAARRLLRPKPTSMQEASEQEQQVLPHQEVDAGAGSPSTPAASGATPLDLRDPYTPWLRTNRKPPMPTPGIAQAAQAAAAAGQHDWLGAGDSPVSAVSSASSNGSGSAVYAATPAAADGPEALANLCAAVADLQLKQGVPAASPTQASSSDDEDGAPLTLGRRTARRVYRRPLLTPDTDNSAANRSSSGTGDASSPAGSNCTTSRQQPSSCCGPGSHRRITPGSTNSLVARRKPSSGKQRPHPAPTDTGYTGAYDFDMHLSTIKPPGWQLQRRQQHLQELSSTAGPAPRSALHSKAIRSPSGSPSSPVAALCFTPSLHGRGGAAAAATPSGPRLQGTARRLDQTFLSSTLPVSPAALKQQALQTPKASSRGTQSALPRRKPPATTGKDRTGQFGKVLWPLTEDDDSAGGNNTSSSSMQPQELVTSRRRPKQQASVPAAGAAKAAAACATAPPKAPSSRTFARQRQQLAQELYAQWNVQVFDGALPTDLPLVWNPRLTATAGQVVDDGSRNHQKSSREERIPVRLELSSKVIDTEPRLRTTLSHEMCHVAAWVISKEWKEHHGNVFWAWARRFETRVAGIKITTCHNFDVHAPFRWQCSNYSCGKLYVRHKRSIDTNKHVCSRCQGRLLYLGKFSRDGKLISSSAAAPAGAATPGGGNAFTLYVKTHFAEVKRALPTGTPHKEVMTRLAARYKEQKLAMTPAAGATPACKVTVTAVTSELLVTQTPAVPRTAYGKRAGGEAAAAAAVGGNGSGNTPPSPARSSSSSLDGWQTADEEVEEQTSSLLNFMDRLALS